MIVLLTRKPQYAHRRLQFKLDHLLHLHKSEDDELGVNVNLQAFRSQVCDGLQGLIAESKEEFGFTWIEKGLKLIHGLNKWFEKLIEELDCPMSNWESDLADEYFNYTLILLDLFNSISSSLSHLQSIRLSLAHALSSPSDGKALEVQKKVSKFRNWGNQETLIGEGKGFHGKQGIVLQAMVEMKAAVLWVCGMILSGLGSDSKVEMGHDIPLYSGVDSRVYGELLEKKGVLKEVKEVKEMMNENLRGKDSKELQLKLERFERKLEESVEGVNCLFSEVMDSRNRLMDCFRLNKK